jgi:malonate decarboxylase epsilon subunit
MLHALPRHAEVSRCLDEASETLGYDVQRLDTREAQRSTLAVQLCLLVAGVATARVLNAHGQAPDMVAGFSVGAYPAAVSAGAVDFADAVRLVDLRARLMEEAHPRGFGMTAIVGLQQRRLETLIAQVHSSDTPVFLANVNSDMQMVIAGSDDAMSAVAQLACRGGANRVERLNVSVPSHCPLLDGVASSLVSAFAGITVRSPPIIYVSSNLARTVVHPQRIADDLVHNVARQVRWSDTVELAWERGARLAIEMPSGNVLTRLSARMFEDGMAVSIADIGLESARTLMDRERKRRSKSVH